MAYLTTSDGVRIFYKDWGSGQPVLFSHGWPLSSDAWDQQMLFFGLNGYRVIAHDRRSHGRSDQTWNGNHMDRYADDLSELIETLDLKDVILIGHSTGGGEVAHYVGRHGTSRVVKVVLVGAVPPLMLKTDENPNGTPLSVFDGIREGTAKNRSQFFHDLTIPFYGFNRDGVPANDGLRESFRSMGLQGGIKGQYDCIHEFSEVDYVYVAAFAPDAGEAAADLAGKFPGGTLGEALADPVSLADGGVDLYIDQTKFHQQFAHDVSPEQAALMAAGQRPITEAALTEQSGEPAWKAIPSWFVHGDGDKNIPPQALGFMAKRADARRTVVVEGASHVVMVSNPQVVADLIEEAAQ